MQDLIKILDELQVPEIKTPSHQKSLQQHLLNNFDKVEKNNFWKGGEIFIMLKSKEMLRRVAVGAVALFLIIYGVTNFNPFTLQKANAEELAQKVLSKVSSLPQNEQEKLGDKKASLQKAVKAKDLHIETQTKSGAKITVLKFTDSEGNEEEIEIDEDDMPIVSPSVTPSPSSQPSGTPSASPTAAVSPSVLPSASPTHRVIRRGDDDDERDDDREEVRGARTQSSTEVKSDSNTLNTSSATGVKVESEEKREDD